MPNQPTLIVEIRATRVALEHRRSGSNPAPIEIGVYHRRIGGLRQGASDRLGAALIRLLRCRRGRRSLGAYDAIDLVASGPEVPAVPLPQQDHPGTGAASVAVVRARAVLIVEPIPVLAAANWAGPVAIC